MQAQHRRENKHGRAGRWLLASLVTAGLLGLSPVMAASRGPAPPEPIVLHADGAGIVVEWNAPDFSLRQVDGEDRRPYVALETPGWMQTEEPGQPRLPFASVLAVVPPAGGINLHVQVLEHTRHPLSHPVVPARMPMPVGELPADFERDQTHDEQAYIATGPRPADLVTIEEVGWMRERRLVRLTFYPMRLDPAGGTLEVTNRARIELYFEDFAPDTPQDSALDAAGWDPHDPFVRVLQASVINPAQVNRFVRLRQTALDSGSRFRGQDTAPDKALLTPALAYPPASTQYLIIAHADFMSAVVPLAAHRAAADGLRVFTTTVQAVYSTVGYTGALAIRDYISHTYHSAVTPNLRYVLLVGDGTDGDSGGQFIPPYMTTVWGYRAASDNRFVTMDGDTDYLADVFIGRLPVDTAAEAATVVSKILAYELDPPRWPWNQRILFFAGHESNAQYHDHSDQVYATLPLTYTGQRAYFCVPDGSDLCSEPYRYDDIDDAHDATLQAINAGGLLASYVGHSSWQQWDWEPRPDNPGDPDPDFLQPMFHLDDVPTLHNGGALPVVLEMTCYTSEFSHPQYTTLDEVLLRQAGGGAVATWGPTTIGWTDGHQVLHRKFFDAVFQTHLTELGPATQAAKSALPSSVRDMHDTYILFGDPAMDLNLTIVPWTHAVFLPVTLRGSH